MMFCSTNVDPRRQQEFSDIFSICRDRNIRNFLDLTLLKGRMTKEDLSSIIEKFNTLGFLEEYVIEQGR